MILAQYSKLECLAAETKSIVKKFSSTNTQQALKISSRFNHCKTIILNAAGYPSIQSRLRSAKSVYQLPRHGVLDELQRSQI